MHTLRAAWKVYLVGAMVLAFALGGCGFKLRGAVDFSFQTIAITPEQGGAVAAGLVRYFGDRIRPAVARDGGEAAQVIVDVLSESREKVVAGVNASGQVREFQLRMRVKFRMRNAQGRELIESTEVAQQRDFSFSESAVLSKEAEEALLYRDMQADLVQQLLRRIAAVQDLGNAP